MSDVPVVVPEGKSMVDLTMGELDASSFQLKADISACLAKEEPGKFYAALIELAYRWAKRTDPKAKRETFREYDMDDMSRALRMDDQPKGDDGKPDPTSAGSGSGSSESP